MEPSKQNGGLSKWLVLAIIAVIIVIVAFIFADKFADARTTIGLMALTGFVVYMWSYRKNRGVMSANEIALYIANTQVRDGHTLRLNPSPDNIMVEETGIDKVMVGFIDKGYVFTFSRAAKKILESWRGHPMGRIQERRHGNELASKVEDMQIRMEEKRMELENEM